MTIQAGYTPAVYTGDGSTTKFAFAFPIHDDSDLVVVKTDTSGGNAVTQVLGTDYTVDKPVAPTGGTITMTTAPAATERLWIGRTTPRTQTVDLRNEGPSAFEAQEEALDRATQRDQEIEYRLGRALVIPDHAVDGSDAFDARNNRIKNLGTPTTGTDAARLSDVEQYAAAFASALPQPTLQDWDFLGDGSTTRFSISGAENSDARLYLVTIDGVVQEPNDDYTIDTSTWELVFADAPPSGGKIDVVPRYARGHVSFPVYATGSLPAASSNQHSFVIVDDGAGTAQQLRVSLRNADGSWSWVIVAMGGP